MYLRATQRRNQDGSVVRYLQLAHNRRVNGVTRAEVLVKLGREDRLDGDGLRRLPGDVTTCSPQSLDGSTWSGWQPCSSDMSPRLDAAVEVEEVWGASDVSGV